MSQDEEIPGGQRDALVMADRYRVVPERRLPLFDSSCAEAFEAQDLKAPHQGHFALLCRQDMPPRTEILEAVSAISAECVVRPLCWGPLTWPPASGARRYVIVFAQPRGGRLAVDGADAAPAMRPETATATVIRPLVPLLRELSARSLVHGAIRTQNLFFKDAERDAVILGECFTAPPGMMQDAVYTTIEEGMANPSGRRRGAPADDFYALGVLLVVLLNGGDPCVGMSDDEIIAAKLKFGSYGSLLARAQSGLGLNAVLRGLLCDEPEDRWSARDLEHWLDGRQLSPAPPKRPSRARRPITFGGEEYFGGRSLAHALAGKWTEALRMVKGGKLAEWARRELGWKRKGDLISATPRASGDGVSGGPEEEDLALARVLIELDPQAPVRFRDFKVHVHSLGRALALDYHRTERIELLRRVMQGRLPHAWFEAQGLVDSDLIESRKSLEQAESFMARPGLGMGFARCLYYWNPGWPCQSPLLRNEYVGELGDLLPALERYSRKGQPSGDPVDSHVAAFCAAQMKQIPDRILSGLSNSDAVTRHLSMLQLLAEVQRQAGPSKLPALTAWFAARLSPLIETFHNRNSRRQIAKEVERVTGEGSLGDLCWLFDNDALRDADDYGFLHSKAQYHRIVREIAWLEGGGLTARKTVLRASRQAASFVAAATSGLLLLFLTVVYLF